MGPNNREVEAGPACTWGHGGDLCLRAARPVCRPVRLAGGTAWTSLPWPRGRDRPAGALRPAGSARAPAAAQAAGVRGQARRSTRCPRPPFYPCTFPRCVKTRQRQTARPRHLVVSHADVGPDVVVGDDLLLALRLGKANRGRSMRGRDGGFPRGVERGPSPRGPPNGHPAHLPRHWPLEGVASRWTDGPSSPASTWAPRLFRPPRLQPPEGWQWGSQGAGPSSSPLAGTPARPVPAARPGRRVPSPRAQ